MNNIQKIEKTDDDLSDFRKILFTGMGKGIDYASCLLDEPANTDYPEYLLTVKIAEELCNKNYKVQLEEKTSSAFTYCFEQMTHDVKNHCCRSNHDYKQRKGKIDIVIYNNDFRTIFGIEIKRIDPKKSLLKKDIDRLMHFFDDKDKIGKSSFKAGYIIFACDYSEEWNGCNNEEICIMSRRNSTKSTAGIRC